MYPRAGKTTLCQSRLFPPSGTKKLPTELFSISNFKQQCSDSVMFYMDTDPALYSVNFEMSTKKNSFFKVIFLTYLP
jgi:hypothetical protein